MHVVLAVRLTETGQTAEVRDTQYKLLVINGDRLHERTRVEYKDGAESCDM